MTIGLGSAALWATIERHAVTVQLRVTEGYVLDNRRWLHGRRAFSGNRVRYRVTANPLPRLAIPSGFPLICLRRPAVSA